MTVSTETNHNEYTGNGVTVAFPYTFRIFKKSDLVVFVTRGEDIDTLRPDTDYTVTGAGGARGGNVVLKAPLANGIQISIERKLLAIQETNLRNQGKFFAELHEDAFDKLTMLNQQGAADNQLALKKPARIASYYDADGVPIKHLPEPQQVHEPSTKGYTDGLYVEFTGKADQLNDAFNNGMYGYILIDSFQKGAILTLRNHALKDERTGEFYRWNGDWSESKKVPAGSTPESAGGIVTPENPTGLWVSVGDAGLRGGLSKSDGALLVGGSILSCQTVDIATATMGLKEGQKVITSFHNVPVVSEWTFTTQLPINGEFYLGAIGGYLVLMTPNFASAGIKQGNYLPGDALHNRDSIERLTRDKRFSSFSFGCTGLFYVLGSMHPLRDKITILHDKGIVLLGRYDDPVFLAQGRGKNYGHMWGFVHYNNLDNGDLTVSKAIEDLDYLLEGYIGTVFDASHSKLHNNNPIGFYLSKNCRVKGSGGVVSSDHRGINYDGKSDNCEIDIGFIRNTSNSPARMSPEDGKYGKIKIGSVSNIPFDGGTLPTVAWCFGGTVDVEIGDFRWDGITKPILAYAHTAERVTARIGTADGVNHVLRQYNTKDASVEGGVFTKTNGFINKSETIGMAGVTRSSTIKDVRAGDDSISYAFQDEIQLAPQDVISITNNNFAAAAASFLYFRGKVGSALPAMWDCRNNTDPRSLIDFSDWNLQTNVEKTLALSGRTFTYVINRRFNAISVQAQDSSGAEAVCQIPIRMTLSTSATVTYSIGKSSLTVTRQGLELTCDLDSGTLRYAKLY